MACNAEYMNPFSPEINLSRILMLTEELETGVPVDSSSSDWAGYKSGVYGTHNLESRANATAANLCSRLQNTDVTKFSPEMQIWWREHQAADAKREAEEKKKADHDALRASALEKLTDAEIEALGLE